MIDWRTWNAAAGGQAPFVELVAARRGLARGEVRAAYRMVREGEVAGDLRVARPAVAIARQVIRGRPPAWSLVWFPIMVLAFAGESVHELVRGHVVVGVFVGAFAVWLVWIVAHLPRKRRNALRAEQLNRDALDGAGQPFQEDPAPVRLSPAALAAGAVVLWAVSDLVLGAGTLALENRPLSVEHVVGGGAVLATFMILATVWMRRRPARQSRQPIS